MGGGKKQRGESTVTWIYVVGILVLRKSSKLGREEKYSLGYNIGLSNDVSDAFVCLFLELMWKCLLGT